jgi:hypothetical protein
MSVSVIDDNLYVFHWAESPSWEVASRKATQEFPNSLWNPKVRYRVHKNPLLVPILSQFKTVHTT